MSSTVHFSEDLENSQDLGTVASVVEQVDDVMKNNRLDDVALDNAASFMIESNLNIFGNAILTMSKFSDQLHMEPTTDGLCLKSINSGKSAYATISLTKDFFTELDVGHIHKDDYNLIRISMKSALAVFRHSLIHQASSSNSKLSCVIQINPRSDYMIFKIGQVYSISKCYVIQLRDCNDTYSGSKILLDILTLVGSDSDVLKFVATPDKFTIERFIALEQDRTIKRKTAAQLDLESVYMYNISRSTEVAINVKELKAVLAFAGGCQMAVTLHFEQPERPVIVTFEDNVEFSAEFVISTFDCGTTMRLGDEVENQNLEMNAGQSQAEASQPRSRVSARRQSGSVLSVQNVLTSQHLSQPLPSSARFGRPVSEARSPQVTQSLERNGLTIADWETPPRQHKKPQAGVFDLDQKTPNSVDYAKRTVLCTESP
uniref:Rad9 n=1 Tax=Ditylenchus dipsaci TaxID=166011 RepID=A0A915DQJ7_9BILA